MLWYELTKDILIPLLAPLGAALTVVVAYFRREDRERRAAAEALYRDLDWLWQQYSLVGVDKTSEVTQEQKAVLMEAWMRVFSRLSEDTSAMRAFYGRYLRNTEGKPFLLIANARQKLEEAKANPQKLLDIEVLFAVSNLLMLSEPDARLLATHRSALEGYLRVKPELSRLLVKRYAG